MQTDYMIKLQLLEFQFYKETFTDFFHFLFNPSLQSVKPKKSVKEKVFISTLLFLLKISFSVAIAGIIGIFYEPRNLTDASMSSRFTPFVYLMVGGLLLPVFEEILFRLSLIFKPIYLGLSTAAATYYFLTKLVFKVRLSEYDDTFFTRVCIGLVMGILVYMITNKNSIKYSLSNFWVQNFKSIYYISCILFAWLHIFNFELNLTNLLLLPILTLPQLFSASISGYIRINFGFQYPLLVHIITNSTVIGLSILLGE